MLNNREGREGVERRNFIPCIRGAYFWVRGARSSHTRHAAIQISFSVITSHARRGATKHIHLSTRDLIESGISDFNRTWSQSKVNFRSTAEDRRSLSGCLEFFEGERQEEKDMSHLPRYFERKSQPV
jgi:hypothetical protein